MTDRHNTNGYRDLPAKLEAFDRHAPDAVRFIITWLTENHGDLVAVARGRHVTGHYRYADAGLFEFDTDALLAEAAEEVADAIVYLARRIHLLNARTTLR